jgi:hypothetical protein
MTFAYSDGKPEDLDQIVLAFKTGSNTNITRDELRSNVTGYSKSEPRTFTPGPVVEKNGVVRKPAGNPQKGIA